MRRRPIRRCNALRRELAGYRRILEAIAGAVDPFANADRIAATQDNWLRLTECDPVVFDRVCATEYPKPWSVVWSMWDSDQSRWN